MNELRQIAYKLIDEIKDSYENTADFENWKATDKADAEITVAGFTYCIDYTLSDFPKVKSKVSRGMCDDTGYWCELPLSKEKKSEISKYFEIGMQRLYADLQEDEQSEQAEYAHAENDYYEMQETHDSLIKHLY